MVGALPATTSEINRCMSWSADSKLLYSNAIIQVSMNLPHPYRGLSINKARMHIHKVIFKCRRRRCRQITHWETSQKQEKRHRVFFHKILMSARALSLNYEYTQRDTGATSRYKTKDECARGLFSLCPSWFPIFSLPALVDVSRWHVRYFKIYIYVVCIWKCVKTLNVVSRVKLRMGGRTTRGRWEAATWHLLSLCEMEIFVSWFAISLLLFWQHIVRLIITEKF